MASDYNFEFARRKAVERLHMTLKRQREAVLATEAQIRMFEELEKDRQAVVEARGGPKSTKA